MKIKIAEQGHQHYQEMTGEVLLWCQTVEKFGGEFMQVPCVIINTGTGILVVPLKKELYWYDIHY